jgi:tetratricopeptide (TPR) repeat protein
MPARPSKLWVSVAVYVIMTACLFPGYRCSNAMLPRTLLVAFIVLISACATEPVANHAAGDVAATSQAPRPVKPAPPAERPFPDDSLHELLIAEFALRRREYNVALETYMAQAARLEDAGVAAHTTRLAQYLDRRPESLEAALLWARLEPTSKGAHSAAARQLVLQGRNAEALVHLKAVEEIDSPANFMIVTSNFARLSAEDKTALAQGVNALAPQFPNNGSLLLTQALIYNELNAKDEALDSLAALFEIDPEQYQALLLEATILADQGAKKPYRRIEKTLQRNPQDQTLRLRYARLLTATDLRAAREQFEILSLQSPDDADLLFSLALINREVGDEDAAARYLRAMVELGERADEAHYYLGRIAQESGDTEQALGHYQAVGEGEQFMAATGRIGEILIQSQQTVRFLAWFSDQRDHYPERRNALFGLEAQLLGQAGQPDLAVTLLNEALAESPQESSLLYARAMLSEQKGDLVSMERDLRDILSREPNHATALNALGYTLANRTDRHEEALKLISRALELQPGEPAILDSMGWVLFRLQRYEEALHYLTRAYAEFPDPEVAAHLGEVMWTLGDTDGALTVWRAAYASDPDHAVLQETLQRLGITTLGSDTPDAQPAP